MYETGTVRVIGVDVDQYDEGITGNTNIMLTSAVKAMNINVTRDQSNWKRDLCRQK
jgi:basic membrane protein A